MRISLGKRIGSLLLVLLLFLSCSLPALAEDDWDDESIDEESWDGEDEGFDDEDEDFGSDEEDLDSDVDSDSEDEGFEEEEEIPWTVYNYDELVVGNPTPMDGKFFTGMWGNATSDIDVRTLVHGYYLTVWGYDTGLFRENRVVVNGIAMVDDQEGNRDYLFSLYDDLYFSDGTEITAWDYAFSVLFQAAPEIAELGGVPLNLQYLEGYEEYVSGEVPYLSGVHVISDHMIRFTIKQEYLPYFFELYWLGFIPYPIHEIAPGCKVYDDGNGAYIGNEDPTVEERIFTPELLRATVMDPESGYLSHPTVGCGPYVMTGWDQDTFTCTFEINPYFKGDEEGYVPTIPYLRYTLAENEDMIDRLGDGTFGLLNKVTKGDTIMKGLQLVGSTSQYTMQNYPRIGLTFIVFTPDRPALQQQNVRQAMAYCFEKEKITQEYTMGFGMAMDGLIGLGQWMYGMAMGTAKYPVELPENPTRAQEQAYEEEMAAWEEINLDGLTHYSLDTERAAQLLEEAGWTLNEQGESFRPGVDAVRCQIIDGELVKLDLTCAYPEENYTAQSMETLFLPHLEEVGIHVTLIPMDMKTLLRSYNDRDIEQIDMFYLGDDFNIEFDPQLFFIPGDVDALEEDTLAHTHAEMYDLAMDMCRTEPTETREFVEKWVVFQERLSELLPMIPVYSNVYFDFYTRELHGYPIIPKVTWGDAIVESYMSTAELEEEEEEEGEEEEDGDLEEFDF